MTEKEDLKAAYEWLESMVRKADNGSLNPQWHGRALRDSFMAGIAHGRNKENDMTGETKTDTTEEALAQAAAAMKGARARLAAEETHRNATRRPCMKCGRGEGFADIKLVRFAGGYVFRLCENCAIELERLPKMQALARSYRVGEPMLHRAIRDGSPGDVAGLAEALASRVEDGQQLVEAWLAESEADQAAS